MVTYFIKQLDYFKRRVQKSFFLHCGLPLVCCFLLCSCGKVAGKVKTTSFWQPTLTDCWPCAIYGSVFEGLNKILSDGIPIISAVCLTFLPIFFGLFLATKVGGVALNPEGYPKAMKALAYSLLKTIVVALLLSNASMFYELFLGYIFQPIGNMFLGIANILLDSGPITTTSLDLRALDAATNTNTIWNGSSNIEIANNFFGSIPYQLQLLVFRIYRALRAGIAIGIYIFDSVDSWRDFMACIASLFIIFYSLELSMVVPFTFVEALLRLGIAGLMLPLLLVCWIFEGSSKLIPQLKAVVPLVLTAFLDIIFTCAFIVVMTTTLQVYTDVALDQMWSMGPSGKNVAVVVGGRYLQTNLLILIVLMLAFTKLAEKVPEISKIYGGGTASSAWTMRNKVKTAAQGIGKTVLGLVSMNWGLAWSGVKQVASGAVKNE